MDYIFTLVCHIPGTELWCNLYYVVEYKDTENSRDLCLHCQNWEMSRVSLINCFLHFIFSFQSPLIAPSQRVTGIFLALLKDFIFLVFLNFANLLYYSALSTIVNTYLRIGGARSCCFSGLDKGWTLDWTLTWNFRLLLLIRQTASGQLQWLQARVTR